MVACYEADCHGYAERIGIFQCDGTLQTDNVIRQGDVVIACLEGISHHLDGCSIFTAESHFGVVMKNQLIRCARSAYGIDFSVVLPVATSPDQVAHINDRAFAMNEHTDESGLISFGSMHPDCPYWKEELTRLKDHGVKGIKLHPVYQGKDLDDPSYLRILDCCAMLGLVVVTHSGYDIGFPGVSHSSPQMALNAVKAIGRGTGKYCLILAHMGGWKNWDDTEALAMEMVESGAFDYGNHHALVYSTSYPGSMEQLFDARYDNRFNTVESFEKNAQAFVRGMIRDSFGIERID